MQQRASKRPTPLGGERKVPGIDVLIFLAEQGLPPTPDNYRLAYERAFEQRGLTARALDAIVMEGRGVTQAEADRIMALHAGRRADSHTGKMEQQQEAIRHQALRLAELTAGAASGSNTFGTELSAGLRDLATGAGGIEQIVIAMIERTRGVEAELNAAASEIDQLRSEVEVVRGDAMHDALTGLLNRRGLTEELRGRPTRSNGTIAMCDVDHFKTINDRHGHAVGDRVLKGVASSLTASVAPHRVSRWGGEEFVIVIEGAAPSDASALLEAARADLASRSFKVRDSDEPVGLVTISIGAASLKGATLDAAIETADQRLYEAKAQGRNRVVGIKRPAG